MSNVDFAAAQRRVVARRQALNAATQAHHAARRQHDLAAPLNRLPASFTRTWQAVRPYWDTIKGRDGTRPAFRVGQVDSELLDEELIELLKGQVGEALKYYGGHLKDDWSAEILLALRTVLFKLTLWDHDASYGASLQNLRYCDARNTSLSPAPPTRLQKSLYALFSVGGRYAWTKWESYLLDAENGYDEPTSRFRQLSSLSSILSTTHSVAAFASFLVFLFNGKYRTVLDRLLRLRLTSTTAQVSREVSFEYLNRQLVWHAFTEFLLFLLPLVGISRWRRWIARAWRKVRSTFQRTGDDDDADVKAGGELGFLPERTCAICYKDQNIITGPDGEGGPILGANTGIMGSSQTDITNPYEAIPCGCKYCFVCLAQRLEAEDGDGWVCLRCGEIVRQCKPWNGDVVEEKTRSGLGKRVNFAEDKESAEDGIQNLEPKPVEDLAHKEAELETELEEEAQRHSSTLLADSAEWAKLTARSAMDDEEDDENEVDYEDYQGSTAFEEDSDLQPGDD